MSLDNEQSKVIQGRFHLTRKLGAGSFGEIFEAKDLKTNKLYACKAESLRTKHPQLRLEYQIYRSLQSSKHFVRVWGYVTHYNHQIMIMDKLGDSLEQLFTSCGRKFSIRCVCAIAIQILSRIEELHKHNYLHRDIKPDNFLIGHTLNGDLQSKEAGKIYMIDLGLGKVWKEGGRHIPEKHGKRLIGTPRYASINTHFGHEQSRRDDLESLGYMLMYFAHGHLPWQGLRGQTKEEKYQKIGHKKRDTRLDELCRGYPVEFKNYLDATQNLGFQEDPPYETYRSWFKNVLEKQKKTSSPYNFDWQTKAYNKSKSSRSKHLSSSNNKRKQRQQVQPQQQQQQQQPQRPNPRRSSNRIQQRQHNQVTTTPIIPQQITSGYPPNNGGNNNNTSSNHRNNNYHQSTRVHHSNPHHSTTRQQQQQQGISRGNPLNHPPPNNNHHPLTLPNLHQQTSHHQNNVNPNSSSKLIPIIGTNQLNQNGQNTTNCHPSYNNYVQRLNRCKIAINQQNNNKVNINPLTRNTSATNSNSPILQIPNNTTTNQTNNNGTIQINPSTHQQINNMLFPTNSNNNNRTTYNNNPAQDVMHDYGQLMASYKKLEQQSAAQRRHDQTQIDQYKRHLTRLQAQFTDLQQRYHDAQATMNEQRTTIKSMGQKCDQLKLTNAQYLTQMTHLQNQYRMQQNTGTVLDRQPAQKRRKLNGMQRRSSNRGVDY